ncbi:MAG: hypothetical protein HWN67_06025 [Candidatus Helarchaeota archaeon]|nr:hypothetical protein [Candidatus Helarchaeota archaeon]
MRFFRRKKERKPEEEQKIEIDSMVEKLQTQIDSQEAQIITFKEDIAPQMAVTIQALKAEIERLEKKLIEKDIEIIEQRELVQKVRSDSAKLQDERAFELLDQPQNDTREYKNKIIEQSKRILEQSKKIQELQKQVDLLPIICTRLVDEMNKRNVTIQNLYSDLDKVKVENVSLSLDVVEIETKLEEALRSMEDKELQTRRLLSSVNL